MRGEPEIGPIGAAFARLMRGQVDRASRRSVEELAELATRELGAQARA
jgi:hypothetical protein